MERLNDNEVKEVARMQQRIDTYEAFILTLNLITRSKRDIAIPLFGDTNYEKEMSQIWRWVKEHKGNK